MTVQFKWTLFLASVTKRCNNLMKVASLESKFFNSFSIVSLIAKVVFLPLPEPNCMLVKISKSL